SHKNGDKGTYRPHPRTSEGKTDSFPEPSALFGFYGLRFQDCGFSAACTAFARFAFAFLAHLTRPFPLLAGAGFAFGSFCAGAAFANALLARTFAFSTTAVLALARFAGAFTLRAAGSSFGAGTAFANALLARTFAFSATAVLALARLAGTFALRA